MDHQLEHVLAGVAPRAAVGDRHSPVQELAVDAAQRRQLRPPPTLKVDLRDISADAILVPQGATQAGPPPGAAAQPAVARATMVSAPPARPDDNPLEETFAIRLGLDPGLVRQGQVDLPPRRRRHRRQHDRCTLPRTPRSAAVLAFSCSCRARRSLNPSAVQVHGRMLLQPPVEHPVAQVLQRVQTTTTTAGQSDRSSPLSSP